MAINMEREQLLTYAEATAALTRIRPGRKLSAVTIWRWAHKGLRGVLLEKAHFGGAECTSIEALQRFFSRLPDRKHRPPEQGWRIRTRREETRDVKEVAAYLDSKGIGAPRPTIASAGKKNNKSEHAQPQDTNTPKGAV